MEGVIVLGAGLAGLGCARSLPGCRVFEAKGHSGGHAFSHQSGGVYFDEGAHICHTRDDDFYNLIRGAAGDVNQISGSLVQNHWRGRWMAYPVQNHLNELPRRERLQALQDFVMAQIERRDADRENYDQWCRAQYGDYLTDEFYAAYTRKYWRVPMDELATDWLGGRLIPSDVPRIVAGAFESQPERQTTFARFRYPAQGGFFRFFERLYDDVRVEHYQRAVEIDPRERWVRFASGRQEHYEQLASSIPLPQLVAIVRDAPARIREAAARLRHTQLLCVNMVVGRENLSDCHWFYIYDEAIDAARVWLPGNLAPGSVPRGVTALQAEVFRGGDEPIDTAALVERTVSQIARLLDFDPRSELRTVSHLHVPAAYVISNVHRASAVDEIRAWLEGVGIHTMGLYGRWKYVWSDNAFRQGEEAARQIKETLCVRSRHRKSA